MEMIWWFIGIIIFAILFGQEGKKKKPGKYDHIPREMPRGDQRMGGAI